MIQEFVDAWRDRQDIYKEWLEGLSDREREYLEYKDLVEFLFTLVINPAVSEMDDFWNGFDIDDITEINNGSYQGTLIYIIPRDTYSPDEHDYIYTFIDYGSCTVCDALQNAQSDEKESCIKKMIMISLHIIEHFKFLV